MRRAIQNATACGEALARLPELDLGELRQQWRALYKSDASPHLSRELLDCTCCGSSDAGNLTG